MICVCGNQFVSKRKGHIYCSKSCCDNQAYIKTVQHTYYVICPYCNKLFTSHKKTNKYCCKQHQKKYLDILYYENVIKPKNIKLRIENTITKYCLYCGNKFKTSSNKKILCSRACRYKHSRLMRVENRKHSPTYRNFLCLNCGKDRITNQIIKCFCDRRCQKLYNERKAYHELRESPLRKQLSRKLSETYNINLSKKELDDEIVQLYRDRLLAKRLLKKIKSRES